MACCSATCTRTFTLASRFPGKRELRRPRNVPCAVIAVTARHRSSPPWAVRASASSWFMSRSGALEKSGCQAVCDVVHERERPSDGCHEYAAQTSASPCRHAGRERREQCREAGQRSNKNCVLSNLSVLIDAHQV